MCNSFIVKGILVTTLKSKQEWINKVPECLPVDVAHRELLFIDKNGNALKVGADFESAEHQNSFPVKIIHLTRVSFAGEVVPDGVELIAQERDEQISKHGRTVENDVITNSNCQLAVAANQLCDPPFDVPNYFPPMGWDESIWEYISSKSYKERLIISGALIAAEIDRLQYIEQEEQK